MDSDTLHIYHCVCVCVCVCVCQIIIQRQLLVKSVAINCPTFALDLFTFVPYFLLGLCHIVPLLLNFNNMSSFAIDSCLGI